MLNPDTKNVLICLRYGIGDVVMSLPVLDALRAALPAARITALANAPAHELLEEDPRVDEVACTARWRLRHRWDEADEDRHREIAAWIRARDFDVVLDAAHAIVAVGRSVWSIGIRSREGCPDAEHRAIVAGATGMEAIMAGVRAGWGIDVPADARPELRPPPRRQAEADAILRAAGAGDVRPVALSPVASTSLKGWPTERFAAVATELAGQVDAPFLILEGPQPDAGEALRAALPPEVRAVRIGPLHLLTTAAVLRRCSALVCNDTGVMHIGAVVGTPTVAAFGPTRASIFVPPVPNVASAEPRGLECAWRETRSLHPPACWVAGRCLISEHSCIRRTRVRDVIEALNAVAGFAPAGPLPVVH